MSDKVINIDLLTIESAPEKSKEILQAAEDKLGFVPNMYKYFANSPALFQTYAKGYEAFRNDTGFSPAEQEVVFLTASVENDCHYCKAAHAFLANSTSNVPEQVTDAILHGKEITDEKLNALHKLTLKVIEKKGWLSRSDIEEFTSAGYEEKNVLDVITGVAVKTLSNFTNHITQVPIDDAFKGEEEAAETAG